MRNTVLVRSTRARWSSLRWLGAAIFTLGVTPSAVHAKTWKGAEVITHQTFRYGAFEARVRAARGGGVITPFFLWKDGSEIPGHEWQEQDFEVFGRDGTYQTQCMTPGTDGANRTEHVVYHSLSTPAWERYYTYRMEWTPTQLAFYVDGQRVRVETDQQVYAKMLDPNRAEAAQLRLSIWAGDYEWSGAFDSSAIPATVFVNWVRTYAYTPGTGANGGNFTELWRDDFDTDSGRFWRANWTFDAAINDYVPENAGLRNGYLVLTLTSDAGKGVLPTPPADDGLTPTPTTTPICKPSTVTYDAAALQKTAGGPATGGWNLWTYGSAQTSHDFMGGDSIVTVKAWGQSAAGVWPHMVVRVGDQVIGETNVQATDYGPHQFFYAAPRGTQSVSIAFDNDYYENGEDRNLYLQSLTIEECPSP